MSVSALYMHMYVCAYVPMHKHIRHMQKLTHVCAFKNNIVKQIIHCKIVFQLIYQCITRGQVFY